VLMCTPRQADDPQSAKSVFSRPTRCRSHDDVPRQSELRPRPCRDNHVKHRLGDHGHASAAYQSRDCLIALMIA
jgi:hypothetical protein